MIELTQREQDEALAVQIIRETAERLRVPLPGLAQSYRFTPIDYIDTAPKPFIVKIPLVEYFERIKRLKTDRWQKDFCSRLEQASSERHIHRSWALIHAEAQLGKSSILAQAYSAWILGHDPLHRIALATYNVTRSQRHAKVVIGIMNLPIHKDIFPNKDGWVDEKTSKERWSTAARLDLNDGQDSFNPVGLQSGLVGAGFDTLLIDDPYSDQKEAFSETTRLNLQGFWDSTVMSRMGTYTNVFGMFHRYHVEDLAGYLLDKGTFDYWRYATQCDGPYIHEETGQKFDDPLNRTIGEYISERRLPSYYDEVRKNNRVFSSMNQGRPSAEEGEFFKVGLIATLTPEQVEIRRQECSVLVRGWDLAAIEEGGDYSVGVLLGISLDGRVTIFDIVREQVDTAGRDALQLRTAMKDGAGVVITIPRDPGAAGDTAVFHIQQVLKGFEVAVRSTSGSKEDRARSFSSQVNSGMVDFATDEHLDKGWIKQAKKELRDFPLSDHDDVIDGSADAYNEAFVRVKKGLVIKNYRPQRNLVTVSEFKERFPYKIDPKIFKIPEKWTTYVGIKITPEASTPNSAIIVTRASEHARMPDTLFVVAEYKEYTADVYHLFEWIKTTLNRVCQNAQISLLWLHKDSADFQTLIRQKLQFGVRVFKDDQFAGLVDAEWFLQSLETTHPFNMSEKASRLYAIVDDSQLAVATDSKGLYAFRQEMATWGFNDKNEPSKVGAVLDCLRMVTNKFRTKAESLTMDEKVEMAIPASAKKMMADAETGEEKLTAMLTLEFERSIAQQTLDPNYISDDMGSIEDWV